MMVIRENHRASDYTFTVERISSIVPGKKIIEAWMIRCPVCGYEQPEPEHRRYTTCHNKCGASWVKKGNSLYLEYEEQF